jgi:tetratricopeptide (TPR) repeat protein
MSASPSPAQVRLWSEEVARDPGTLAFLPLAEVYRHEGRREAALRLCLRGLERHPTHVEAHYLLGLLYREGGEEVKAFDEWDIALRLDPEHAGARREIGLLCAARGEWAAAARHLERAAQDAPADAEVQGALARARAEVGGSAPAEPAAGWDPAHAEFRAISGERGVMGAILLDEQGLVIAGEMRVEGADRAPEVAAALCGASSEAERVLRHLGLGAWQGILLETPETVVRIAPVADSMLAVAARREVPTGWVLRVAARARTVAARLLGAEG